MSNLTLTRVVFEYAVNILIALSGLDLTLTRVVFESGLSKACNVSALI